jgi:hypothetical protein
LGGALARDSTKEIRMRKTLLGLALLSLAGCGSDISGQWRGTAGSDSMFLDLSQDGQDVSGNSCEAPGKDCSTIQQGTFADGKLSFYYEWSEAGATPRVTVSLSLDDSGDVLSGTAHSTKCNCDLHTELTRQ